MKKNNPHTPIMLREALDTQPRVFTRYGAFFLSLSLALSLLSCARIFEGFFYYLGAGAEGEGRASCIEKGKTPPCGVLATYRRNNYRG